MNSFKYAGSRAVERQKHEEDYLPLAITKVLSFKTLDNQIVDKGHCRSSSDGLC